jgi:uncharacterized protein (TIGR00106 family)
MYLSSLKRALGQKGSSMAMMEITVIPIGTNKTSVSPYIADITSYLRRKKNVQVELSGMGTTVTGPVKTLFRLAAEVHDLSFRRGAQRVFTVIKIDDRRDKSQTPADKVASVLLKIKKTSVQHKTKPVHSRGEGEYRRFLFEKNKNGNTTPS